MQNFTKDQAEQFFASVPLEADGTPAANVNEDSMTAACIALGPEGFNTLRQWQTKVAAAGASKAAASDDKADWREVDVKTLSADAQKAYESLKAAQRKAAELREAFEKTAAAGVKLAAGRKLLFGYRFGRLSVAIVADSGKSKSSGKAASLSAIVGG